MQKTFCDACDREIRQGCYPGEQTYSFSIFQEQWGHMRSPIRSIEICYDCAIKINEAVKKVLPEKVFKL